MFQVLQLFCSKSGLSTSDHYDTEFQNTSSLVFRYYTLVAQPMFIQLLKSQNKVPFVIYIDCTVFNPFHTIIVSHIIKST